MSLRRDVRRLLRAATRWLNADAKRRGTAGPATNDGGGAAALNKALDGFQKDPVLESLDTTPPRSYANFPEASKPVPDPSPR